MTNGEKSPSTRVRASTDLTRTGQVDSDRLQPDRLGAVQGKPARTQEVQRTEVLGGCRTPSNALGVRNGRHYRKSPFQRQATIKYNHDRVGVLPGQVVPSHNELSAQGAGQDNVQAHKTKMGQEKDRLVGGQTESPTDELQQVVAKPDDGGNARVPVIVGEAALRVSPMRPERQAQGQEQETEMDLATSNQNVTDPTVLPVTGTTTDGQTPTVHSEQGLMEDPTREDTPNGGEHRHTPSGMECVRSSLQERGISREAADLLVKGIRLTTRKTYDSAWAVWRRWCEQKGVNLLQAQVKEVLQFLTDMFNQGKEYKTISVYRSALSAIHPQLDGHPVGQSPLVLTLMKAIHNERPPKPKGLGTWDVDKVLLHIKGWGDNDQMDLKLLSHKVTMLIALTSAARASELQALTTADMIDTGIKLTLTLDTLSKTSKVGETLPTVEIHEYLSDSDLDPVSCIRTYLERTIDWRSDEGSSKLLRSTRPPYGGLATSTISNWLKSTIHKSGISSDFRGHSTRAASTSKAIFKGLSVKEIIAKANWSSANMFYRHYNKFIFHNENVDTFANTVLDTTS